MRTECETRTEAELRQDVQFLQQLWSQVLEGAKKMRAPACVHRDQTLLYRTIRDMFNDDIHKMVIDDPEEYEKAHLVARVVSPSLTNKIFLYDRETPIFDFYNIEKDLDRLLQHKVHLKSGAYLVIDEMEALTAIDVNTGKMVGSSGLAETILKTNLEAADEVCRQLRLRDMGGNVWEWCQDRYDAEHDWRVLRGGSWYNDGEHVRCAYRNWFNPDLRDDGGGFRVMSPGI